LAEDSPRVETYMNELAPLSNVLVPTDQVERVLKLYENGLYLQAFHLAETMGPLKNWHGAEARILAGRMAGNLGSMRLADWHFVQAYRQDRRHPEAMWYFARYLLGMRGPLAAWKFVGENPFPTDAPTNLQSHWCSQHAAILGRLRDFDAAEQWLQKAEAIGEQAWTCLERAAIYNAEDRHEEAEGAARRALEIRPWYRPAIQWVAHFLVQKERDAEALDLLTQAAAKLESAAIYGQLAALQFELKRFDDAARNLDEFERHSPILETVQRQWLAARRCDLACQVGDLDTALDQAKKATGTTPRTKAKFYENLVTLLEKRTDAGKRVEIPVGFVRQHHRTCVPATLVSIAKFWTMPAEHLEVAAEISYAGTPNHSERQWARDNGWHTKEFTVTWDSAVALLDRGIPFTLTTREVTMGHLQAVVGYDSLRRTLIIRDPGERHKVEMAFDAMLERYRATGPRGMALVPSADKAKLESLPLPDETLYDLMHRMERSLKDHNRDEASQALGAMVSQAPRHFLTLTAKRLLALYDADLPEELKHTEELLELFPGDQHLEWHRARILGVLGRYSERVEILKRLAEKPNADPACWQLYAQELSADARQHAQALYLLRKAIRRNPLYAYSYGTLARIRATQRKFDETLQLFHFAACVEEKDEYIAQDYFNEARAQGKTAEAMRFLQNRFERLGAESIQPARTYYTACVQEGRFDDAFNVLERAMKLRPDDGDLLTYSADAHMYLGEFAKAAEILQRADGVAKPAARFRSLAFLAGYQQDATLACEYWGEVLKIEPTADDAHRYYCQFLHEQEGRSAVLRHLDAVCKRFPHHFSLNRLMFDWLYEDGPAAREKILKKLIDIHPADAWTRREYAVNLMDQDRTDEGFQQLDEAEQFEPFHPSLWHIRGLLFKKAKNTDDARYAFREAIRQSVDFQPAIQELVWQSENLQDRRDAVAFVVSELLRQTTFGGGLVALAQAVQANYPPQELLASHRRIRDARPDLWTAWQAVTRQCGFCEIKDEYFNSAQQAIERFPAISDLWLDLAEAQRVHKNADAEMQALKRALELAPNSIPALQMLIQAHERAGNIDQAKSVAQQAMRRTPLNSASFIEYADLLYRCQEHDEAMKQMRHALKLDPWHDRAWTLLMTWCQQLERVDELIEVARGWTVKRPGEWRSWFRLALAHQAKPPIATEDEEKERIDACLAAYDEAIKRNPLGREVYDPRNAFPRDLHDSKAEMLALVERYEEALKACNPLAFKGKPPIILRGRAAWVKAQQGEYDAAKLQMLAILKEDRFYQWGWDRLVDWSMATHDYRAYHDAANEMLRARPQSAIALTYRGEARVRMDERESGIEDLRAAHRKDPCFQLATFLLFDEQMNDEDYINAETTLLSMKQSIAGDFVDARQVQLHAKRENKSTSLEIFKELCTGTYSTPQAMDMAMRALDVASWKSEAEAIIRDAMQKPNWHTHLALMFASYWNPNLANDLPDRIAAIDRGLERLPWNFRFLDLKAELLTTGSQFERAWKACKEKTYPQDQPWLDGRAAWVVYRGGRTAEGIVAMRELVKQHPKYFWGWMQLADWYGRQQQWVDVLTVAEELVQINPRDPMGFGYRGQAKQMLGDADAARTDYLHALDLQPSYIFAAWQLFDMYVRKGEWQRADKILEKSKKHADKGEWALRKVDMCVYQNRKSQFAAEFENLLRNSSKMPWLIDQSLQYLVQAGWWSDAEAVLHRCLDIGAHICDPWVRLRVAMGDRTVGSDVQNMSEKRPERTNCIAAYAFELAYAKDNGGLRRWIVAHDECLRDDTPSWAKITRALTIVEDWHGIIEWMSDWDEHDKALPGMLLPLIKAQRSVGQIDDARKVSLYALTKLNPDYASTFHKVWLMLDQALEGDILPVQRYLESSDLGGFDGYHQMIAAMVRALWLTSTDKERGFATARQVLADTAKFAPPAVHDPALGKAYQKCVTAMARQRGTVGAKLWRWWRWLRPTLPAVQKMQ
jgi:cellulose synthase operon protein C